MKSHEHKWVICGGESICEIFGRANSDVIFEENCYKNKELYGFHCWRESNPSQANAIKILEDKR